MPIPNPWDNVLPEIENNQDLTLGEAILTPFYFRLGALKLKTTYVGLIYYLWHCASDII